MKSNLYTNWENTNLYPVKSIFSQYLFIYLFYGQPKCPKPALGHGSGCKASRCCTALLLQGCDTSCKAKRCLGSPHHDPDALSCPLSPENGSLLGDPRCRRLPEKLEESWPLIPQKFNLPRLCISSVVDVTISPPSPLKSCEISTDLVRLHLVLPQKPTDCTTKLDLTPRTQLVSCLTSALTSGFWPVFLPLLLFPTLKRRLDFNLYRKCQQVLLIVFRLAERPRLAVQPVDKPEAWPISIRVKGPRGGLEEPLLWRSCQITQGITLSELRETCLLRTHTHTCRYWPKTPSEVFWCVQIARRNEKLMPRGPGARPSSGRPSTLFRRPQVFLSPP